jgi:hypothetical protein
MIGRYSTSTSTYTRNNRITVGRDVSHAVRAVLNSQNILKEKSAVNLSRTSFCLFM